MAGTKKTRMRLTLDKARRAGVFYGLKVYNSFDIRREVAMDKALILSGQMDGIEWIFKGCVPSGPLNDALIDAGITIKLIP